MRLAPQAPCIYCGSALTHTMQAGFCALEKSYVCWCPESPQEGTRRVHEPDWDAALRELTSSA